MQAELLLSAARRVGDAVASTFGPDCEVAVHDLRRPQTSLVHLSNGHVTGRQLGTPIRDPIFGLLPGASREERVLLNYRTVLDDGRQLKSTTVVLRGPGGEPLIAFCINLDLTQLDPGAAALRGVTAVGQEPKELG